MIWRNFSASFIKENSKTKLFFVVFFLFHDFTDAYRFFCSATPGTTYPTQQTGYSVTPGATAAAYPTQRTATGYETYQTQATPTAYAGIVSLQFDLYLFTFSNPSKEFKKIFSK